jgi:hypothetical protein
VRVKAFSLTSNCSRAASHSFGDTIGGVFMANVLFWSADAGMVDLPFAFAGLKPGSICSDAVKTFEAPKRSQLNLQKIAAGSGTKPAAVSDWELRSRFMQARLRIEPQSWQMV